MSAIKIRYATKEDTHRLVTINITAWKLAYRGFVLDEVLEKLSIEKSKRAIVKRLAEQSHELSCCKNLHRLLM